MESVNERQCWSEAWKLKRKQCSKFHHVCMSWPCGITVTTALLKVTWISVYWYLFYPCRSFSHSPLMRVRKKEVRAVNMLTEDQLDKYLQSRNAGVWKQWKAYRTPMNISISRNIELHFMLANLEKTHFWWPFLPFQREKQLLSYRKLRVTDKIKCTAVQNSHRFKKKSTKTCRCFFHF